jgi:hypothetical protein
MCQAEIGVFSYACPGGVLVGYQVLGRRPSLPDFRRAFTALMMKPRPLCKLCDKHVDIKMRPGVCRDAVDKLFNDITAAGSPSNKCVTSILGVSVISRPVWTST